MMLFPQAESSISFFSLVLCLDWIILLTKSSPHQIMVGPTETGPLIRILGKCSIEQWSKPWWSFTCSILCDVLLPIRDRSWQRNRLGQKWDDLDSVDGLNDKWRYVRVRKNETNRKFKVATVESLLVLAANLLLPRNDTQAESDIEKEVPYIHFSKNVRSLDYSGFQNYRQLWKCCTGWQGTEEANE